MNPKTTIAGLAAAVCAPTALAQPATLDVDESQSSIFLEIELDTPLGAQTEDDTAALDGTITIELDDYDNPTAITIVDYSFTSGALSYVFDYSFLGTVTASATGLSLGSPAGATPATGTVDGSGVFTVDNVESAVTGIVDIGGTGTIGGIVGSSTIDLSTLEQQPISVSGMIDVTSGTITASVDFPISNSGTDPDTGVVVTLTGSATVVATGPVPEEECPADVNGDGLVTPTDFSAWVGAFNTGAPECDQNGDGMCTPTDFSAWVGNYNAGC